MSDIENELPEANAALLARTLNLLDRPTLEWLIGQYVPIPHPDRLHRNTVIALLTSHATPDMAKAVEDYIHRGLMGDVAKNEALGVKTPAPKAGGGPPPVRHGPGRPPGARNKKPKLAV